MPREKTPWSTIKERHINLQCKNHPTSSYSKYLQIMSSSDTSPQNTSSTPNEPGRWVVTEFGTPSVLKWQLSNPATGLSPTKNVLIRILVAGIAGVDNIQRCGGYPDPLASQPGFTPGYDLVGEIIALHDSIPNDCELAIGDRVTSLCRFGAHATHIVLPWEDVIKIRPDDDMLKICALPLNYMTAWGMLKHSGVSLPPGSTILMGSASGGLGTAVAQLIRAFDMRIRVIGTCSPSKFEYVRELGVEPIDRNAGDLVEQVMKLTGGEGVDVAFDGVCSEDSVRSFRRATKEAEGRVVVFGVSPSQTKITTIAQLLTSNLHCRSWATSLPTAVACSTVLKISLRNAYSRRASASSNSIRASTENPR
jgi:NADPH2:quinone reductase